MNGTSNNILGLPPQQLSLVNRCFHPTGTFIEFKKEEVEQSIPDRFEEQVRRYPHRLAIKTRTEELTYNELNRAANRVAHCILDRLGEGQKHVALLFEQCASAIVAMLGVLKAGKVFVPLDRSLPADRLRHILSNSGATLVLTNGHNLSWARELIQDEVQALEIDNLNFGFLSENPRLSTSHRSPAYIIYTSGSTGEPKGVVQSHHFTHLYAMNYTNYFHVCQKDRLALLYSYSLGSGANLIFAVLCSGASLYTLDIKEEGLNGISEWIHQEEVTIFHSLPTVFRQMARSIDGNESVSTVRLIVLAGEQVDRRDVDIFRQFFSKDCIFVNRLGSTEAGGISQYFMDRESQFEGSLVPSGYPIGDDEVLLLDEDGREIGPEGVGEIVVRKPFKPFGYLRMPDLTQAVFRPVPDGGDDWLYHSGDLGRWLPDGSLMHLGRNDSQVRIRGNRIETAEVELVLLAHDAVTETVVVAQDNERGDKYLVAFLVGDRKTMLPDRELRGSLRLKLPDYMIPSAFVRLDSLPKLPGGKIDRRALPAPSKGRPDLDSDFIVPRTPVEEELTSIWAEVLDLDEIGVEDNFLELGGDSLRAGQVISRVVRQFRVDLPLRSLLEAPTVAEMSLVITQSQAQKSDQGRVERMLAELDSLASVESTHILDEESEPTRTDRRGT